MKATVKKLRAILDEIDGWDFDDFVDASSEMDFSDLKRTMCEQASMLDRSELLVLIFAMAHLNKDAGRDF